MSIRINHGPNEQPKHRRKRDNSLEPEESSQLVRPKVAERKMDKPAEEECEHDVGCDAGTGGEVVGDIGEVMAEYRAEHVVHVFAPVVH